MLALINIAFCYTTILIAALTAVPLLKYSTEFNAFIPYEYSLLYIVTFILSVSFKHNYSFAAVALYLISGLVGLPVFAFGGGWAYVLEPSFGFLLGLFPLAITSFYNKYHEEESGFKTLCGCNLSPIYGLLIAHGFGIIFLIITGRFSFTEFLGIHIYQLCYDLIFGYSVIVIIGLYGKNIREVSSEQDPITDL